MSISDICIRRPVFTWVLVAIPVVLGMVAYNELGVDLFPKVDFPVISISAALPGASRGRRPAGGDRSSDDPRRDAVLGTVGHARTRHNRTCRA